MTSSIERPQTFRIKAARAAPERRTVHAPARTAARSSRGAEARAAVVKN
jgi:hypothetical protein